MAIKSKKPLASPQSNQIGETRNSFLELGFTIDESLSMEDLKDTLLDAFNRLLTEINHPDTDATLVLFSDAARAISCGRPIAQIQRLHQRNYLPNGRTALLDAIAYTINEIAGRFERHRDKLKVLVAIFTDGFENSSRVWSRNEVAEMIGHRQSQGWQFVFITPKRGRDYGLSLKIPNENIVDFDNSKEGVKRILEKLGVAIRAYQLGDRRYARFLLETK
jgi:hypothetical protein